MISSIDIDRAAFDASRKEADRAVARLGEPAARKLMLESAHGGLIKALQRHFSAREKEPHATGWWNVGQTFPKRYFWRGTRGDSVYEKIKVSAFDIEKMESVVTVESPALKHKIAKNPPAIRPKGHRYLAIPASAAAANWQGMPRDFPGGLRIAHSRTPGGRWLLSLVAARSTNRKSPNPPTATPQPLYWLVHKVKTRHDPNALPPKADQIAAATSAVKSAIRIILSS